VKKKYKIIITLFVALGFIVFAVNVYQAFHDRQISDIPREAPLDQRMESLHFIFYYAKGDTITEENIKEIETHFTGFCKDFDVSLSAKIDYYKYASREHKKFHTDRSGDSLAILKPQNDIHTIYPTNVHEMVHILAQYFGNPPLFLSEGIAVAYPGYYTLGYARYGYIKKRNLNERVKSLRKKGELIPLEQLLDVKIFMENGGDRSYVPSGSFVRYIIDKYGTGKFKDLYSTVKWDTSPGDFKKTFKQIYSIEFKKASEEWMKFVLNN